MREPDDRTHSLKTIIRKNKISNQLKVKEFEKKKTNNNKNRILHFERTMILPITIYRCQYYRFNSYYHDDINNSIAVFIALFRW